MRKRRMHASLILMALCIYLQWGRGVSVRNTISSSRDGKRTEHITIVANKLYIGDKEAFAGEMIETCINNEFRDVRFSYDGRTDVIRGVSMDIRPGQTVALVGPSGGGKSTLASLICRFFDVGSGSICVGGADVRDIPKEELMDTVSFVFQNSRLLKGSILDNVKLGRPDATEAEALSALRAAQCMDIIEKFPDGIHTVIGSKGVYLSGGEQQRIAIARAMLKNAPILILDEATAFADPDNEAKVQAALAELAKGKTVVMIAHRLSTVVNADCIYVVQDGRIAEAGTKGDLCARNGLFAKMWQDYQSSVRWKVEKEGPAC